ncbi:unnamed protein product [Echinostoma caproni]|uniref:RING-type E3 ubiquitin transferase n=1 Tax=Echinostoma caproni TaxID=27848 RepID=A0A183AWV3_9TREM|nr:unnamed protein product [Echinostoma caproni]
MRHLDKSVYKEKFHQFHPFNFQCITEANVYSMPPPSKQARKSPTSQYTIGNVSEIPLTLSPNSVESESSNVKESVIPNTEQEQGNQTLQEAVRSLITCAICLDIPKQAYQCSNGHLICIHCVTRLLQQHSNSNAVCPSCRIPLHFGLRRCLLAEQLASELPSDCRFCGLRMVRKQIEQHETTLCPVRPVTCRFSVIGCQWFGKWNQLEGHFKHCPYKDKPISEIEPLLVTALHQNQIWTSERNQFPRGLLAQLAKSSGGLKAFRRQIAVSREVPGTESCEGRAIYQSTSNLFRCCGLKRITVDVTVDHKQGDLHYCIKSKWEQTSEISFRLCLVHCGDVEFDVNDQLRTFRFSSNQKESPTYSTKLMYHRTLELSDPMRKTLDQISTNNSYYGFPLENLKNACNLLLEFIVFKDRTDILDMHLDDHSNDNISEAVHLMPETAATEIPGRESSSQPNSTNSLSQTLASSSLSSPGYWNQISQTPTNSFLRSFLNPFLANQAHGIGNNNSPVVISSLPQSMLLTLTSLSPSDARIRLVELGTMGESIREDTENEESDDNSSVEDDNTNTSEETDTTEDCDTENENDPDETVRTEESNNNALDSAPGEEDEQLSTNHRERKSKTSAKPVHASNSNHVTIPSSSSVKTVACVERPRANNRYNKSAQLSDQRTILQPKRQARCTRKQQTELKRTPSLTRKPNRNGNMSVSNRIERQLLNNPLEHLISSSGRKRVSTIKEDDSARPRLPDSEDRPSEPKRPVDEERLVMNPAALQHSSPRWLGRMVRKFTRLARFFVRSHVAAPLSYLVPTECSPEVHACHGDQCGSETRFNDAFIALTKQSTIWSLPTNENPVGNGNLVDGCNQSNDNCKVFLPVDSLPPTVRSLRANIGTEVVHLAKSMMKRQDESVRSVSETPNE